MTKTASPLAGESAASCLRVGWVERVSLVTLAILIVSAVAAPLIACDRPFVLFVPEGSQTPGSFGALPEGWSSPWLSSLFDARYYESFVDRLFNGILLLVPLGWICAQWGKRRRFANANRVVLALVLVGGGTIAAIASAPRPALNYKAKIERLEEAYRDGDAVIALFAPLRFSPRLTDATNELLPPSLEHWIGTDRAGRDVFARLLFGTRISLTIGVVGVAVQVLIGVIIGGLGGFFRGWLDAVLVRFTEVVACFPTLLLILTLVSLAETRSLFVIVFVIGLTGWPTIARLVRSEFQRQIDLDYTTAARALGLSRLRIAFRHLLPNAISPVLVSAAFGVAGAILLESALAFLQLSDPSVASWGGILRTGRESGEIHLILAPGLLIFGTVTAMNIAAERLSERLDPRSTQRDP